MPLRVATADLEQRAFELLSGDEPAWRKSIRLDLNPESTVETVFCEILEHCLDHLKDNERCTLMSDHPEGVHQMRVAMRRMRSALRIFRSVLPPDQYMRTTEEVKWLTKSLADTRDLDVFMDEIVGPVAAAFPDEPAFEAMRTRLAADRDAARAEARKAVASPRYTRFLLETGAWIARRAWRNQPVTESSVMLFQPITGLADRLIAKRFKRVRKEGKRFADMTVEEKHQLRIDVKRLRYAIDFFNSLYPDKRVRTFTLRLQKLQDGLGYMNDLAVAGDLIGRLIATADKETEPAIRHAGALVLGWHAHAGIEATQSLAKDVKALISGKPFWTHEPAEES
jgi:CHAD domain-containing protein